MTFCNIECWKYTFSLWNIDILAPQMHAGRPAGGSPETVPTGTQPSAKNSINPCTKWGGTFRHPINPCIICTFLTPECKKCYKSLHETHPALLAPRPGTTMDISFSLRQDPLEQALFGEFSLCNNDILQYRMLKIYIFLMKYWHFGPANARREAGGRQPGNRADRDPAECKK